MEKSDALPIEPYQTYSDALPQLLRNLLGLRNTTRHVPFASQATQTSFTINVETRVFTANHSNCARALGRENLKQEHYPFSYQLTS